MRVFVADNPYREIVALEAVAGDTQRGESRLPWDKEFARDAARDVLRKPAGVLPFLISAAYCQRKWQFARNDIVISRAPK